jgi:Kef-type K+ transport system membrane component KefB
VTDTPELKYVGLLIALFVVPRMVQRLRIPAAVTAFALGAIAGPVFGLFTGDAIVGVFSTLGITSLFLFAGLDVDLDALRREALVVTEHLAVRVLAVAAVAALAVHLPFVALDVRAAVLVALALLTPSTGFILESLAALDVSDDARFWIRTKAIATELLALATLFVTVRSTSSASLVASTALLVALIAFLPVAFRVFASVIVPKAPRSEFSFLLAIATACALVTRRLGVYYLVGAFAVGLVARRFRDRLPSMGSEKMLHAVEAFASVFVPFYFFHAGSGLRPEDFSLGALGWGAVFFALAVPLRILLVGIHRRLRFGESFRRSVAVSVPLLPTLVFTIVIADILRDGFAIPEAMYGGLIVYALATTVAPSLLRNVPAPEFEMVRVPPLASSMGTGAKLANEHDRRLEGGTR